VSYVWSIRPAALCAAGPDGDSGQARMLRDPPGDYDRIPDRDWTGASALAARCGRALRLRGRGLAGTLGGSPSRVL